MSLDLDNRYTDYDPWAWLYDKSEADLSYKRFLPIFKKLLYPHLVEGSQIFDLCCGTGQLTQHLVDRGYQLTGLDGSDKMLHYARKNAPKAQFILGDARSFNLSSTFDAVICTDSALNHIMSLEDLKSVFQNVYAVLKEGGLFIFDLGLEKRYRNIPVNDGELREEYAWMVGETYDSEAKQGTFAITIFQPDRGHSAPTQPNSITHRFKRIFYNYFLRFVKPSAILKLRDRSWQSSELVFSVKPYSISEIQSALEEVGFTSVEAYNFFGRLASSKEKRSAYFVAQKASSSVSDIKNTDRPLSVSQANELPASEI